MSADPHPQAQHVRAFLAAVVIVALTLSISFPIFRRIERPYMRELLAQPFNEKDQGMLLQQEAMKWPDVVPVYGSSELRAEMDKRADELFKQKARGFQVCPVGAAGNTTLMMAQKIAAQGEAMRGKKVAFILAHTWFRRAATPSAHMAGNFSPLQAISLLQEPSLDESLRQRYVARLLEYPDVMEHHPIIDAYLHSLIQDGWLAKAEKNVLRPVLQLYRARLQFEDHLNTIEAIFKYEIIGRGPWEAESPKRIKWRHLIRENEREIPDDESLPASAPALLVDGPNDEKFLQLLRGAKEWDDFALLLDTLRLLKAEALIISVPFSGPALNRKGVSRAARDYYYHRIGAMSAERGFRSATFSEQDLARDFLVSTGTHLEVKGWLHVDRLLDDFYRNRLRKPPAQTGR